MAVGTVSRRVVLCTGLMGAAQARVSTARAEDGPVDPARNDLPKAGDFLVSAGAEGSPVPLRPDDIASQDLFLAWAYDPRRKIARDGSRLNLVLLMNLGANALSDAEKPRSADGVVAYSAICTHQQCTVADWLRKEQVAQCPCHQSRYDLRDGARVVGGPAPRPLPALPLRVADGLIQVSAPFTSRVGGEEPPKS